ncbi:LuxR C-terminal-related transcriptional regulator [Hymenobacter sp. BT730]|uniref:LuxR C-terminal-related transcriptional regulator n=1 Tax=Hymenobacter sp. BT730 TaxID=3063332 RepID=UPI0026E09909|nr:LuxR C-terminal-related transcriptional regulator [Hymenobacter sp. BT730]
MEEVLQVSHASVSQLVQRYRAKTIGGSPFDKELLLQHNPLLEKIFVMVDCGVAIFDASQASYVYISDMVERALGYKAERFLTGGLDFTFSIVHPDDLPGLVRFLELEMDYLDAIPEGQHRLNYRSSYDYRLRCLNGNYMRVLQRNAVLDLNQEGHVLRTLLIISNISHLKKDHSLMTNIISDQKTDLLYTYDTESHTLSTDNVLSKRELEILRLLGRDFTSKDIADKLFISVHTVETHRRNMLEKTNIKDTSKLVSFAEAAGLI